MTPEEIDIEAAAAAAEAEALGPPSPPPQVETVAPQELTASRSELVSAPPGLLVKQERWKRLQGAYADGLRDGDAAGVLGVAKAFGITTEHARKAYPEFKRTLELAQNSPERWERENPEMARMLDFDPTLAPVVLTDKKLSPLTQAFFSAVNYWKDVKLAVTEPLRRLGLEGEVQSAERLASSPSEQAVVAQRQADARTLEANRIGGGLPVDASTTVTDAKAALAALPDQVQAEREALAKDTAQLDAPRKVEETSDPRDAELASDAKSNLDAKAARLMVRAQEAAAGGDVSRLAFQYMQARALGRPNATELESQLHDAQLKARPRALGDDEGMAAALTQAVQGTVSTGESLLAGGAGAVVGAVAGGLVGAAVGKSPGVVGRSAATGARLLGGANAARASFVLETGSTFNELSDARREDGTRVSFEEAAGAAVIAGALKAGIEMLELKALAGSMGPLSGALKAGDSAAIKTLLQTSVPFRTAARDFFARWGQASATEGAEEAAQGLVDRIAARAVVGTPISAEGVAEDAVAGVLGALPLAGAGASLGFAKAVRRVDESVGGARQVQALAGLAGSPSVKAAPESFAAMVQEAGVDAGGKPISHLYVEPQAVTAYLQTKTPAERRGTLEAALGVEGANRAEEAMASGQAVEVPVVDYLKTFADSELGRSVIPHTKVSADHQSAAEMAGRPGEAEASAATAAQAILEREKEAQGLEVALDQLESDIVGAGAKKADARAALAVWRHFYETQARDAGVTAAQFASRVRARFFGAEQQAPSEQASSRQQLFERFMAQTEEQRAAEFLRDPTTGVRNRRAFERASQGKQVAVLAVRGMKFVNDTIGHDGGDAMLTAAAQALGRNPLAKSLAKVGGDFAAVVETQAELDQLLAEVNADPSLNGFQIEGALGGDVTSAASALVERKKAEEAAGTREPRGARPLGTEGKTPPSAQPSADFVVTPEELARYRTEFGGDLRAGFGEVFIEKATGLLTPEGWALLPRKRYQMTIDLNGVKDYNNALGTGATDEIIEAFGKLMTEGGGAEFDATHKSGDEYVAQSDNLQALTEWGQRLTAASESSRVKIQLSDGKRLIVQGLVFGRGMGENVGNAEKQLNEDKARLTREGKRGTAASLSRLLFLGVEGDSQGVGRDDSGRETEGGTVGVDRRARPGAVSSADDGRGAEGTGGGRGAGVGESLEFDPALLGAELEANPPRLPSKSSHTEEDLASARKSAARIRDPQRRAWAQAFLDFVDGWESGAARPADLVGEDAEATMRRIEKQFARFGVVDPQSGFRFEESGRSTERRTPGKRTRGPVQKQPRALAEASEGGRGDYFYSLPASGKRDLKQTGETDEKGRIELPGEKAVERVYKVFLSKDADLSTIMHESSHAFLDILKEAATAPNANERSKETWAKALEFLGSDGELTNEHHEKWARSFEAWLLEGAAPTKGLAGAFSRFKLFLTRLYGSVAKIPQAELNPLAREVFSRLLVVDTTARRHVEQRGPAVTGDVDEMLLEGTRRADLAAMREVLRETKAWWKEEAATLRPAAEEAYDALPAVRAKAWLSMAKAEFGEVQQGEVAELMGFGSVEEMESAVASVPDQKSWVDAEVVAQMNARHPSVLSAGQQLERLIAEGLQKPVKERILADWKHLAKLARMPADVSPVKLAARAMVDGRRLGQLRPERALEAERRAAQAKAEAALAGNYQQAAMHAERELLNAEIYELLTDASAMVDRLDETAAKLGKSTAREKAGKARPEYRDAIDFLLARFLDGRNGGQLTDATLTAAAQALEGDEQTLGEWVDVLVAPIQEGRTLEQLTVAEARALQEALNQFKAAVDGLTTVIRAGKRVDLVGALELAAKEADALRGNRPPPKTLDSKTFLESTASKLRSSDGFLLGLSDLVRYVFGDGTETVGWQLIMRPLREAKYKEAEYLESLAAPMMKAMESLPKSVREMLSEKVDGQALFPNHTQAFAAPSRKYELFAMALNAGNEGNFQRLTDGRNITRDEVAKAIDTLPDEVLALVEEVWKTNESLREEAFALEERDSGLLPTAVVPVPLTLPSGRVLSGGYMPAVYESVASPIGERQQAQFEGRITDGSFTRVGTSHNHTKKRAKQVTDSVITLSLSAVYRHFSQVAHDLAYREALKSVARVTLHPTMQRLLVAKLGEERTKFFRRALEDIGGANARPSSGLDAVIDGVRAMLGPAVLGFRTPVILGDVLTSITAVPTGLVSAKHFALGLANYLRDPWGVRARALEASPELRNMVDGQRAQFRKEFARLADASPELLKKARWVRDVSFFFNEQLAKVTSTALWEGAYQQGLEEGLDNQTSVRRADDVITRVFPQRHVVEAAAILRDKGFWGKTTMFYSYLSAMYRLNRGLFNRLGGRVFEEGSIEDKAKTVASVAGAALGFYVAFQVLPELFMGRGPEAGDRDKEDPESNALMWRNWFLRKLALAPLATLPIELAGNIESKILKKQVSPRANPLSSVVETVGSNLQKALDGDKEAEARFWAAVKVLGVALPTSPINIQGRYLVESSEQDGILDAVSGVLYGPKKSTGALNPVTAIQSLTQ